MTIKNWALGYVQSIIKAHHPVIPVDTTQVVERYKRAYATDLERLVLETPTDTLIEVARQFGDITNQMIHEGHRERYGTSHPRCPIL
jgi:hypothetical protein